MQQTLTCYAMEETRASTIRVHIRELNAVLCWYRFQMHIIFLVDDTHYTQRVRIQFFKRYIWYIHIDIRHVADNVAVAYSQILLTNRSTTPIWPVCDIYEIYVYIICYLLIYIQMLIRAKICSYFHTFKCGRRPCGHAAMRHARKWTEM